jgi:hypothetical protein
MLLDRVSTVRGSGWGQTVEPQNPRLYRTLNIDPPATAGGTDPVQVQVVTFEAKPTSIRDGLNRNTSGKSLVASPKIIFKRLQ